VGWIHLTQVVNHLRVLMNVGWLVGRSVGWCKGLETWCSCYRVTAFRDRQHTYVTLYYITLYCIALHTRF